VLSQSLAGWVPLETNLLRRSSSGVYSRVKIGRTRPERVGDINEVIIMSGKMRLILGVLTALAMMFLTYALPRGGALRDAALVQFPMTAGVWAIFVLLFVKLK
jgi:hypothetical protein